MRHESERFLKQAEADFRAARNLVRSRDYFASAFFCHQASEKWLKALRIEMRHELIRTHELYSLAKRVDAPEEILDAARELDPQFTVSRYPDAANGVPADLYTEDKAKSLLGLAERIRDWVLSKINS